MFFSGRKERFSIEKEIFPQLAEGGDLAYYIHKGFWTDAGTEERLKEVRDFLTNKQQTNDSSWREKKKK